LATLKLPFGEWWR